MSYFHIQVTREYVEKAIREKGPSVLDNPAPDETTDSALAKLAADPRTFIGTCPVDLANPDGSCPGHMED